MRAELISFEHLLPRPWKNGGGSTTEIAVFPFAAGMDDFDWRISMATIDRDGPFSLFPGIDRTLSLVAGAGVDLQLADGACVPLRAADPTHGFAGEVPITAHLPAGSTRDFNVMTRRERCHHRFHRIHRIHAQAGGSNWQIRAATTLFFLADGGGVEGGVGITNGQQQFSLNLHDTLRLDAEDDSDFHGDVARWRWHCPAQGQGTEPVVFVVEIFNGKAPGRAYE